MGEEVLLTDFLKHFVTLVKDEDLEVGKVEVTSLDEGEHSSWGSNNDVWLFETLEQSDVLIDRNTTIDDLSSHVGELSLESQELLLDLISELSVVTENESRARLRVLGKLMENGKDEDSSLSHTRFGLAEDIDTHHCLRDAFLLDFRRVLETALSDGAVQLCLKKHVLEAGGRLSNVRVRPIEEVGWLAFAFLSGE